MQEHGRVILIMPKREGYSQRTGERWASQDFVIETEGRYPRKVRLSLFGVERVERARLENGEYITCHFEIEAREHEGQFYNDLRCFDIVKNGRSLLRNQPQTTFTQNPQQTP